MNLSAKQIKKQIAQAEAKMSHAREWKCQVFIPPQKRGGKL
jgi:hypothetical protein